MTTDVATWFWATVVVTIVGSAYCVVIQFEEGAHHDPRPDDYQPFHQILRETIQWLFTSR